MSSGYRIARSALVWVVVLVWIGLAGDALASDQDRDCWQWGDYLHWSGQMDASAHLIATRDDRTYAIEGNYLRTYAGSTPGQMTVLDSYPLFNTGENSAYALTISDEWLFVGTRTDIRVYDISNPTPSYLGSGTVTNASYFIAITVSDHRVYAICDPVNADPHFIIFNLPDNPISLPHVGVLRIPGATDLAVSGNYAYVAAGSSLKVVDIQNGADPTIVRSVPASASRIALAGHFAYVSASGVSIIDIANPLQAAVVGFVPIATSANRTLDIVVDGTTALVAFGYVASPGYIVMIDAVNPAEPVLSGLLDTQYTPLTLALASSANEQQYGVSRVLAAATPYILAVDWVLPSCPPSTCHPTQGDARTVEVEAGTAFVLDHRSSMKSFEAIDLATGTQLDRFECGSAAVSDLAIDNGRAFIVANRGNAGANVLVVDVSNPGNFRYLNTTGVASALDVVVSGNRVGVVTTSEVRLYNLMSDASLSLQATGSASQSTRIVFAGDYLVTAGLQTLRSFRRSGNTLIQVGTLNVPSLISDLCVYENHLYVSSLASGLMTIEVAASGELRERGGADVQRGAVNFGAGVAVAGGIAYVAYSNLGVVAFDVADPANPRYIGGTPECSDEEGALRVAAQEGYVCLANGEEGIQVLANQCSVSAQLSSFTAVAAPGVACLSWMTPQVCTTSDFRLVGSNGTADWEVPIVTVTYGNEHEVWDRSAALHRGGGVVYRLYLRSANGQSTLLGEVGAQVPPGADTLTMDAYPNPFNPQTVLHFETPANGRVCLTIHDLAGRKIAELVDEWLPAGHHERRWTGCDDEGRAMASGQYLARLQTESAVSTHKLCLIR